jgi:hypothetical protein
VCCPLDGAGCCARDIQTQTASQAAFLDYVDEVEHAADRLQQFDKAIADAITAARPVISARSAAASMRRFHASLLTSPYGCRIFWQLQCGGLGADHGAGLPFVPARFQPLRVLQAKRRY